MPTYRLVLTSYPERATTEAILSAADGADMERQVQWMNLPVKTSVRWDEVSETETTKLWTRTTLLD